MSEITWDDYKAFLLEQDHKKCVRMSAHNNAPLSVYGKTRLGFIAPVCSLTGVRGHKQNGVEHWYNLDEKGFRFIAFLAEYKRTDLVTYWEIHALIRMFEERDELTRMEGVDMLAYHEGEERE